ncbi:MAG TPA: D-alanyl-D-alanine carboxypeptidase/D-alanyl-D-alanine-endopeptidase [Gemmatimonadales bacterium]|nr:D-alanyl-D-alanine carboxypeptidase/D-alanyl-D-alanine-endopeptidase [Gemmatimonadales bacterium]
MDLRLRQCLAVMTLVVLTAGPSAAGAQQKATAAPTLQDKLTEWYRRAARAVPGDWGVAVADQSGQFLWGVNATKPLIPASTAKVFTTGFARTVLGGSARQSTRVLGTGYADAEGNWMGTWALEVNGDPTLERPSRSGPMLRDLAAQLAERGIRRLTGPLIIQSAAGSADASYPTAWAPKHRGRRFAPLIGAVTLNENLISFTIAPGPRPGTSPRVVASTPDGMSRLVDISARTVTGRSDRLRISVLTDGRYRVTGSIGTGRRGRTYSGTAANPRLVLEAAWGAALDRAGIEWVQATSLSEPGQTTGGQTLAEVVSAPLDSIAQEVNTRSLNIGAEALLGWAGGWSGEAARKLTEHVREVIGDESAVTLVDGSGLSYEDRATPMAFVTYLARFPATPAGRNFPLLLPANGSGTLRRLANGLPAPGVVRAKTGTLGNAATLVGYLGQKDGMLLVSVMYNGPRVAAAKQQQWRLFRVLGADGSVIPGDDQAEAEPDVMGGETVPPE